MEQNNILTKEQQDIILRFSEDKFLTETFYFTGGTALSSIYLNHRYSEDLDFFSAHEFDIEEVQKIVAKWAKDLNVTFTLRTVGNVYMYTLNFSNDYKLKIDFAWYPYKNVAPYTKVGTMNVDSLVDIATNKFVAVGQRTDVKDFVDLYYLLKEKKFAVFDLFHWSNAKFKRDYDIFLFACDLLKSDRFDYLPKMIKSLELDELKVFYRDLAKNLGMKVTGK